MRTWPLSVNRRGVPNADRRAKLMLFRAVEGSILDAYSHTADAPSAVSTPPTMAQVAGGDRELEGSVAQLQSEIRVLKILLESERNARREEEARHARTIEALQREIEIASRGWAEQCATGVMSSRVAGARTTP
jgi:hypothetical protein